MTEGRTLGEIFGLGNRIKTIKQLRDESGASLRDAKDALKDAHFDVEEARRLLKERGQWETPEIRKVKIAENIEGVEEYKRFLRQQFEDQMAEADQQIEGMKAELRNIR